MHPYERLIAWQHAHELFLAVYQATENWPRREWYGLTAQIRRSAFSVPVNIVEGSAKRGRREFRRFLDISLGSLCEVQYTLRAARDIGILPLEIWTVLEAKSQEVGRTLWGLARTMDQDR